MNAATHDTVRVTQCIEAPIDKVWGAYADVSKRSQWGVPKGEAMIYVQSDFREGGRDRYRCGPPETLEFQAESEYTRIVPEALIVYTETVKNEDHALATAVSTWEFETEGRGTRVRVTTQVVSFIGAQMIDGTRNGHTRVLAQLGPFLAAA